MPKKTGGSIVEGLWAGTAVFAAVKANTYVDFISKFLLYAVFLIVALMIVAWVLRTVTGREMFSVSEIKCPPGSSFVEQCPGTSTAGCYYEGTGNCEASLGK